MYLGPDHALRTWWQKAPLRGFDVKREAARKAVQENRRKSSDNARVEAVADLGRIFPGELEEDDLLAWLLHTVKGLPQKDVAHEMPSQLARRGLSSGKRWTKEAVRSAVGRCRATVREELSALGLLK